MVEELTLSGEPTLVGEESKGWNSCEVGSRAALDLELRGQVAAPLADGGLAAAAAGLPHLPRLLAWGCVELGWGVRGIGTIQCSGSSWNCELD